MKRVLVDHVPSNSTGWPKKWHSSLVRLNLIKY